MKKLMIMLSVLIMLLGVTAPSVAQDDWPEGCQLPDLEEAINAASEGDVALFLNSMNNMEWLVHDALQDCLEAAVRDDVDLSEMNLSHTDLSMTDLEGANLQGAVLIEVNLYRVDLSNANLKEALFFVFPHYSTTLQSANLEGANLQGALLDSVNLQNANLVSANLMNAALTGAIFDEYSDLPDGTNWTPDTDMARFTDPTHPDFWDPCVELDSPPWYCEDDDE